MSSATPTRRSTVWMRDEELDEMYTSLFRELLTYMMEDPRNITPCTHLLFMAKNIERIGDHATNIAETIYFLVKGVAARRAAEGRRNGVRRWAGAGKAPACLTGTTPGCCAARPPVPACSPTPASW